MAAAANDGAAQDDPGSRLCRACGICCTGAMFAYVDVEPQEVERLRTRLPVIPATADAGARFLLGCEGHVASGCSLYEDRPKVCSSYRCNLLVALRDEELSLDRALAIVEQMKTLYHRLDGALPPGKFLWDRALQLRDAGPPAAIAERRRHAGTLLDLKVLERMLCKYLDDRASVEGEPAATPGLPPAAQGR